MTIASEIIDLQTNLAAAKAAVTTKGGTVGDTGLAGLASEIATIPSGGSLANYGSITYLDANNVEQTLTLATEDDYLELTVGQASTIEIEVNGVTMTKGDITGVVIADGVQYIPNNFCNGCSNLTTATIPSSVHIIGENVFLSCNITTASLDLQNVHQIGGGFLQYSSNFDSSISLPKVREIGNGFLMNCSSFNSSLIINDSCEVIGSSFLRNCTAFAQSFSIPSGLSMNVGLTNPGDRFMQECKNFVGPLVCNCPTTSMAITSNVLSTNDATAPLYATGVTLTGTYANDWKTTFQDRDSSPYRKLIVGA